MPVSRGWIGVRPTRRAAAGARERKERLRRGIAVLLGLLSLLSVGCGEIDLIRIKGYLGSAGAQIRLGYLYGTGEGVERDDAAATKWYRRAAEQGHPSAQVAVGNRYLQGLGVEQDAATAASWFQRAADQGEPEAQARLGMMLAGGLGIERNDAPRIHRASPRAR